MLLAVVENDVTFLAQPVYLQSLAIILSALKLVAGYQTKITFGVNCTVSENAAM